MSPAPYPSRLHALLPAVTLALGCALALQTPWRMQSEARTIEREIAGLAYSESLAEATWALRDRKAALLAPAKSPNAPRPGSDALLDRLPDQLRFLGSNDSATFALASKMLWTKASARDGLPVSSKAALLDQAIDALDLAARAQRAHSGADLDSSPETRHLFEFAQASQPTLLAALARARTRTVPRPDLDAPLSREIAAAWRAAELSLTASKLSLPTEPDVLGPLCLQAQHSLGVVEDLLLSSAPPSAIAAPLLAAIEEQRGLTRSSVFPMLRSRLQSRLAQTRQSQALHAVLGVSTLALLIILFSAADRRQRASAERDLAKGNVIDLLDGLVEDRTTELFDALGALDAAKSESAKKARLAVLGSLVAGVAHEINTPIGNMLLAQTTFRHQLSKAQQAWLGGSMTKAELAHFFDYADKASDLTVEACERCAKLVSSFKQVSADQASEASRDYDADAVLRQTIESFMPTLTSAGLPISIDIDSPDPWPCRGKPGMVSQALTILLHNATIHAFEGRKNGAIRIGLRSEANDDLLRVTVADDGVGMDSSTLTHAFDPFFSTKHGLGGTGIGLSVARQIANAIGGELHARSEPGQGSAFDLVFPRVEPGETHVMNADAARDGV